MIVPFIGTYLDGLSNLGAEPSLSTTIYMYQRVIHFPDLSNEGRGLRNSVAEWRGPYQTASE